MNKSDLSLLERFRRARDADAFAEIVSRYQDFVYGTCLRILGNRADSQDVSQECFLRLLRKADTVRTSLGGWLHRCATDLSIDELRGRAARRNREEVSVQMNGHANNESDSAGPSWQELAPHLDRALEELPEELREVVVEYFLRRRTQAEIAKELGVSKMTVSRRLEGGIEQLRQNLKRAGVVASAAVLAALITENASAAAPAALAASLSKLTIIAAAESGATAGAAGAAATAAVAGIGSLVKVLVVVLAVAAAGVGVYKLAAQREPAPHAVSETDKQEAGQAAQPPAPQAYAANEANGAGDAAVAAETADANAADYYKKAFELIPKDQEIDAVVLADFGTEPADKMKAALEAYQPALTLVAEGAAIRNCDWGIDLAKGGSAPLLPIFSQTRQLARAARFRARCEWAAGRRANAIDDLRNALVLARHIGGEKNMVLISMLVQVAIERMTIDTCAERLTDAQAADLIEPVVPANENKRHLLSQAIAGEKTLFIPYTRKTMKQPAISPMTLWLDQLEKEYDETIRITALPYQQARPQLAAQYGRIKAGFNPFAKQVFPALTRAQEEEMRLHVSWAMLRAGIAVCRDGEAALNDAPNPAGTGPFQYTKLEKGFELKTEVPGVEQPVVLEFGKR
ncbi:MAG TPA: sigma-70 family RNA polymerase sigma factor [Planctomycetota bacterium]|nr:sigma-70 family RNA polymerase sigma factor [Planctomycetota bacterium]